MKPNDTWMVCLAVGIGAWVNARANDLRGSGRFEDSLTPCLMAAPAGETRRPGVFVTLDNEGRGYVSFDGMRWAPRTVSLNTNWRSCTRSATVSVMVGCDGRLRLCSNAVHWLAVNSRTPSALHGVAFGNGRFVAVGNEGAVVSSEDGVSWTVRKAGTDERLRAVAFGNGLFVAVGYAGTILTSPDGIRWTARESGVTTRLQGVAFGAGTFVAVGWHGVILSSETGTKWAQQRSGAPAHLQRVTFICHAGAMPRADDPLHVD